MVAHTSQLSPIFPGLLNAFFVIKKHFTFGFGSLLCVIGLSPVSK